MIREAPNHWHTIARVGAECAQAAHLDEAAHLDVLHSGKNRVVYRVAGFPALYAGRVEVDLSRDAPSRRDR